MVQRDRHRAHAAPAIAAQVVALDRRSAAPAALLEATGHEDDRPTRAAATSVRASREGRMAVQRPVADVAGSLSRAAVRVREDDRCRAPATQTTTTALTSPARLMCALQKGRAGARVRGTPRTGRRGYRG